MSDKEEIRDRNDIVEVIGTFVPLKQKGRNWLGFCPFHQEKTPSFNVTPVTQSFKCFGCGKAGDVFSFIEQYENMTFVEAAEFLARRAGLTFDRKGGPEEAGKASERDLLFAVNKAALDYFRQSLERVAHAKEYLQARGLAYEIIQKFQLGYAPEGWDNLTGYLQRQRSDLKIAATAGLVHIGKSGDYYDVFRHRILFPIHDEQERIVGFGGRAFGDDQPKYLNTGETPIFLKSKLLYGLPFARRKIASDGKTLLMEGYMDVIAAHQAGFTNAVATLGTSLTKEHARKLGTLAPIVSLIYDGDSAGVKATLRAAEVFGQALEEGGREVELQTVRLPEGEDPDSVLKRGDIAAFQKAIDEGSPYVEFLIHIAKSRQNLTTEEGKAKFLSDLSRILVDVPRMEMCDLYLTQYANLHPFARYSIQSAVEQMRKDLADRRSRMRLRQKAPRPKEGSPTPVTTPSALSGAAGGVARGTATGAGDSPPGSAYASEQSTASGSAGTSSAPHPSDMQRPRDKERQKSDSQRPQRSWTREERAEFERRRYLQSVRPVETARMPVTSEERAENEILRALAEPDWRARALKCIQEEELLTPLGRRFYRFIQTHLTALYADESMLGRLLNAESDEDFSSAMRERLQEFQTFMAKVPITETLLLQCADLLRQAPKKRETESLSQELMLLLQKTTLTSEDLERVHEFERLLKELKGTTG